MKDDQQQKHDQKTRQAVTKAQINRDKARRKLLRQRKKLARRRTRNRQQSKREEPSDADSEDESRNPTAHSTLPSQNTNAENAVRNSHSTVPAKPKYSNVPPRERLYGQRLHEKTTQTQTETGRREKGFSQTADERGEATTQEDRSSDE